jgi:hypothetical protein
MLTTNDGYPTSLRIIELHPIGKFSIEQIANQTNLSIAYTSQNLQELLIIHN